MLSLTLCVTTSATYSQQITSTSNLSSGCKALAKTQKTSKERTYFVSNVKRTVLSTSGSLPLSVYWLIQDQSILAFQDNRIVNSPSSVRRSTFKLSEVAVRLS